MVTGFYIGIDIKESNEKIETLICQATARHLNKTCQKAIPGILIEAKELVGETIRKTPEYSSLINGILRAELGLIAPQSILEDIIDTIKRNMEVKLNHISYINGTGRFRGGLKIGILRRSYKDLYGVRNTEYISNGFTIPWLKWLLEGGDSILVNDYYIDYDLTLSEQVRSRSGKALMFEADSSSWRMRPEFVGYKDLNWLTNAMAYIVEPLKLILIKHIKDNI